MQARIRAGIAAGAVAALAVGLSAAPGVSQTTPGATTVAAVSGSATGAFADVTIETESPLELGSGLTQAMQTQDPAAVEAALAAAGIDLDDIDAEVLINGGFGPAPTVTLPPTGGGPITDSATEVSLVGVFDPPFVEVLDVSTEGTTGAAGRVVSSATAANINPIGLEELLFAAELVEVECSVDLAGGPVGTTRVVDGETVVDDIPELPEPNSVVVDIDISVPLGSGVVTQQVLILANEQVVGANDISVTGLHGTANITFTPAVGAPQLIVDSEVIIGETSCGVVPGAVLTPTFTG